MAGHYQLADRPALVKDRFTRRWKTVDIRGVALSALFQQYRDIEVPVLDFYGEEKTLHLYRYAYELRDSSLTISQWFLQIGNRGLLLKDGFTDLSFVDVNYLPLTYLPGTFSLAKAGYHPSHEVAVEDYDDVIVQYNSVSPAELHKYSLFSVNGLFLPTTYHQYGLRIKHAGDIIRRAGNMSAGLLNFERVGVIKQHPITAGTLYKLDESLDYYDELLIKVPGGLFNKSVGIVLGGHLHLLDGVVTAYSDSAIKVSLRNARLFDRLRHSQAILGLEFPHDDLDDGALVAKLRQDQLIYQWLTSPYSFVVTIDNSELFVEQEAVSTSAPLGAYIMTADRTLGWLVDHLGRAIDYWPKHECGLWALLSEQVELPTQLHDRADWWRAGQINTAAIGTEPTQRIQPTMRQIRARRI